MRKIDIVQFVFATSLAVAIAGCAATEPPPPPPNNPADLQVRSSSKAPASVLVRDETTLAIEKQLSATEADVKSAQSMHHNMNNMPGMQQGGMQGMQHEGMKMEGEGQMKHSGEMKGHQEMQHGAAAQPEKKAVADEMKKTADEMKETSDAMKQKSEQSKPQNLYYTCPMHPQIHADKPGKCPICGMTLVKKKAGQ
jgi:rubrerythrin